MNFDKILITLGTLTIGLSGGCREEQKDKKKNKELKAELETAQGLLEKSQGEMEIAQKKLDDQKTSLDQAQSDYQQAVEFIKAREAKLDHEKSTMQALQAALELKEKNLADKNNEIVQLSGTLSAQKNELQNLEMQLTNTQADNQRLTQNARYLREKIMQNELALARSIAEKSRMTQEIDKQKSEITELNQLAQAVKKTMESKSGIYLSQAKIDTATPGSCYHIAEIKADGKAFLSVSCAEGQVEIMKAQVLRLDMQDLKTSLSHVGMLMEIAREGGCAESPLDQWSGMVLDKGRLAFSALDQENIVLQDNNGEQIPLTSVAMSGFVVPTPSLELARKVLADSPQSSYKKAVVQYLEKSSGSGKTGCFDKNLNFKPNS